MSDITWIQPYYDIVLQHVPVNTKTILDVGAGYGIFGYILKQSRDCPVDAIEPYGYEYDHYDYRYKMTWQQFFNSFGDKKYDTIVSTEMIEHMEKDDALLFLQQAKKIADRVIIATPYEYSEQKSYDGNKYQVHRCLITANDLADNGYKVRFVGTWGTVSRYFATRIYFDSKLRPMLRLFDIRPTNIIGVWEK